MSVNTVQTNHLKYIALHNSNLYKFKFKSMIHRIAAYATDNDDNDMMMAYL